MNLKGTDKKVAVVAIAIVIMATLSVTAYGFYKKVYNKEAVRESVETSPGPNTNSTEAVPSPEVAADISKDPPKKGSSGSSKTTQKSDGSKTTTVTDGSVGSGELADVGNNGPGSGQVAGIKFVDETGQNASLEAIIKSFMTSNLRYSGEIAYLYQVTIRNAGASGWEGQWAGSYNQSPSGDITSAYGYIILNTYYHQSSPYFNDYMKLVFAHEYGHHYTMYHKWVDLDLAYGVRFPTEYYTVRPLSPSSTAPDYSLGWANCDAEIIAEDYSYFYSGYGYHAMSGTYGYPSGGTKTWLVNLTSGGTSPAPAPATDNPPTVSITEPGSGQAIAGVVYVKASASDDIGIAKVGFYIDGALLAEDSASPYQYSLITTSYGNGSHTLKTIAYDTASQTADSSVAVTINNVSSDTENPTITITELASSPYTWSSSVPVLTIKVRTTDNVGVTLIRLFINSTQVLEVNSSGVNATWDYGNAPVGTYFLKAQAWDAAGNTAETTITIDKI